MTGSRYWTDVLDQFVRFFERYAPEFPKLIVGASDARIDEAERLAEAPFPPEYRAFLQTMGETPEGALGPFLQYAKFGIDAIESFYRTPGLRPPRDAVYLWTLQVDAPYDILIETQGGERDVRGLTQAGWGVDPQTGALLDREPRQLPLGGSLMRSLYEEGFLRFRDPRLPEHLELRDRAGADESTQGQARLRIDFVSFATQLGFTPVPFMDGDQIFYDRSDASLKLYAQPGANVVYVRADDERELERLSEILSDNLHMAIWR